MINTILSQISGVLQKDFLFASLLPALLLIVAVAAIFVAVLGPEFAFTAYDALTATQQAGLATLTSLGIVVVAYLLSALRGSMIRIWSGESRLCSVLFLGPVRLAELLQARRFSRLRSACTPQRDWLELAEEFRLEVAKHYSQAGPEPTWAQRQWLMARARSLYRGLSPDAVRSRLYGLAALYAKYSGESLRPLYRLVKRELTDWAEKDSYTLQRNSARLDRSFGTVATIRATALGNTIEAYNHYAYKRYRMEAELLWPRLRKVIPDDYLKQVQQPKILLDFAATMTTISVVLGFAMLTAGPWLWLDLWIWAPLALATLLAALFFYFLSVDAATQYGDMIRSCFDLFRMDLLKSLQFERPTKLGDERAQWEKIGQLLVYGQESDLKIRAESAGSEG